MGNPRSPAPPALSVTVQAAIFVSLGATIFGARLWLINKFGSSLPIHDQWGGEGFSLLKPWFEGRLRLAALFESHNEHRIFFSRILALTLTQLNGQWDSLPEMVFNALLATFIGVGLLWILLKQIGNQYRVVIAITLALWLALPYALENTLWGFQSEFYFLLLFSLAAIWGLGDEKALTVRWWIGAAGAVFACLSMASGFLASAVVLALLAARLFRNPKSIWRHAGTLFLTSLIVLASLSYRLNPAEHEILKAASMHAWLIFFARCLAFPFLDQPLMALVVYFPLACLALCWVTAMLRSPEQKCPLGAEFLLALGLWAILQSAALAYSRGGDGHDRIASRYMDILALGAAVNGLSIPILLQISAVTGRRYKAVWISSAIWIVAVVSGGVTLSYSEVVRQKGRQGYLRSGERAIRAYLITGDHRFLEGEPHPVPYIDMAAFQTFIDDPTIRRLLPASARLPLRLAKAAAADETFVQPGCPPYPDTLAYERSWGSFSAAGAAARGQMQSQIIHPRLPYLEFEIAGSLGQDMSLAVKSDGSDTVHWLPQSFPEEHSAWRRAYSAVSSGEASVLADDNSATKWFAFREPAELGRLSLYSEKIIARGRSILIVGLILALAPLTQAGLQLLLRHNPPRENLK